MASINYNNKNKITLNKIMLSILTFLITLLGFINGQPSGTSRELNLCRQMCYQKFIEDWHHCMDFDDCKNMCITPPNINNYIPEAFSFLCWNSCDQTLGPFPLNVQSASRQGSLIITDIAWDQAITNASKQCLVTWEVSGGGLMGNLLTDSSTVELSLWSDTVYHVQVTCKNKETGGMRRSYKLIVDTRKLSGNGISSTVQPIDIEPSIKSSSIPEVYSTETLDSDSESSRMKILKDSSKDFISNHELNSNSNSNSNSNNNKLFNIQKQQEEQQREFELEQQQQQQKQKQKQQQENKQQEQQQLQELNNYPNDIEKIIPISHTTTILHSKLSDTSSLSSTLDYSSEILSRSILFTMLGSISLFLGIIIAFIFIRNRRDTITNDKQNLINNEILPDSRTLHV
ncbi:myosin-G heavy chain-like [Condylostylus longicornis]|uniref:myosin-G heavy chain-like n=1 Tax=Condylostylus longicornis TaxID=2530218 RepID=UPI00244E4921|nr:myosin-G heavy chain-like [Condylostylus longicornis]